MPVNDNDAPIDKKKPGCFAIAGLFIIAWILVCFCWAIIQTVSKTQHLPMHTADFVQLHVEEKTNHAQKADQRLDFLEPSYLRRKENHLPFSYCFGDLLGESALLCPPFIGQVVMGMTLMQERRGEGVMMGLDMEETEKRAAWFGIIDVLGATFLISLPAFLIQRTITKKIRNRYSQKEILTEGEELKNVIINDNKPKARNIGTRKIKIALFILGEILLFFLCAEYWIPGGYESDKYDYFSAAWLCVCVGILVLYVIKYISNTIKTGIHFYKKDYPEKALACFTIALLLIVGWCVILNYGMCIFLRGDTFLYLLDKRL